MDWSPQIVVKADDANSVPTSVAALKTFSIGFPDDRATVHCIGREALSFVKEWALEGDHKVIEHLRSTKKSQLHYEIVKRTRLPVALIAGTTVFYDDVSDYNTTKLFGADTIPQWNLADTVVNIKSIEKTLIFVAEPLKVISTLNDITKYTSNTVATEGKNSNKWGNQSVVMDGKVYHQTSGIFNMLYNFDSKLMTNFSSKTANKYDSIFGGESISGTMQKLEALGRDTSKVMKHVNAGLNEDWEGVKGIRNAFLDMIS
tara:strand:+ start:2264 stop:3040 length:777 start_codon:yes stop_codon:yes gene_type:complete